VKIFPGIVVLTTALVLSACSGGDDERAATPAPSSVPSATTPSATASATPSEDAPDPDAPAVDYGDGDGTGAVVADPDDAADLPRATADFRDFLAAEVTRLQNEAGNDCKNEPQIRVNALQRAGWAAGGVFTPECGGYAVLWAKQGDDWSQVWGGQELVDCATLARYRFPVSVAGDQCLSQGGAATTYRP
jgi:hypothetical protein